MKAIFCGTAAFLFLLTGCTSLSTLQTARVLAPGEGQFSLGGGVFQYSGLSGALARYTNYSPGGTYPFAETMVRFGLGSELDLGIKAMVVGPLMVDLKYQLVAADTFAASIGVGLGSPGLVASLPVLDAVVPLIFSIEPSSDFGMYLSPKYYARRYDSEISHLVAFTGGLKVGSDFGAFLEGTYVVDLQAKQNSFLVNGALALRWGGSEPKKTSDSAKSPRERPPVTPAAASPSANVVPSKPPVGTPPADGRSRVLKVGKENRVLVSQASDHVWAEGDPACVRSEGREPSCGLIEKATKRGAILDLGSQAKEVHVGDEVVSP